MTVRRVLLPSELPDEATSVTSSDWGVIQVSGERKLRKIRPGVLPAKSVGAAEIDDKAVTLAKLADVTGYRLIGRSVSTAGQPMEVTCTSFTFDLLNDADAGEARATLAAMGTAGGTFTGTIQRTNGMYILAPGASDDPVYAYQQDHNTGICFPATDTLGFTTGGTGRASFDRHGHFTPASSGTYRLGASGARWSEVWCTQSSLNSSSDARLKTDIETSDLGLDFVLSLRPVSYRWIVGDRIAVPPADPEAPGARDTIVDKPGVRRHYGLIAQELRDALAGHDFAGYCYDAQADEYSIRYGELIAPLIKAVQELAARVSELEAVSGGASVS